MDRVSRGKGHHGRFRQFWRTCAEDNQQNGEYGYLGPFRPFTSPNVRQRKGRHGTYTSDPNEPFPLLTHTQCGDAAHATTPHQGSGAGFAIEDAYILSSLLGHTTPDKLEACLEAYNAVRRERGLKLVTTSREAGKLWDMEDPVAGADTEKIVENASKRMDWIWNEDLEAEIQQGLRHMER